MLPDEPRTADERRKFFDLSRDVRALTQWLLHHDKVPAGVKRRAQRLQDSLGRR